MCSCTPTRGDYINRWASAGARIVTLRARIPELEKLSRRTPPKTLIHEWSKVRMAKVQLDKANADLVDAERDYALFRTLEVAMVPSSLEQDPKR